MTATSAGTITLAGGNNITLSTAASAITISGPNTHAAQTAISGINDGANTVTSGTISLVGNNLTWSLNGQTLSASVAASHAVQTGISGISASDTLYTSGSVRFTGSNMVTVKSGTGQLVVIDATQVPQTGISGIANSQTTYVSGTVSLSELGAITIRSTTGQQYQFSVPQTSSLSAVTNITISTNGSTISFSGPAPQTGVSAIYDGANSISSGTVRFTNANNVTFTINGQTISGSVHAQQTGISGISNSETGYTSGTVNFSGLGGFVVRSTTGNAFQFSQTVQTQSLFSGGVSNLGNTAGSTAVTGTRLVLVGNNEVTLSQSTDANGATVSIVPAPAHSRWVNGPGASNAAVSGNNSVVSVVPIRLDHPVDMSGLRMAISISVNTAANTSSAYIDQSYSWVLYTRNATTLNSINSASTSYSLVFSSNVTAAPAGGHQIEGAWASTTRLSQGEYWIAVHKSTNNAATNASTATTALGQSVSMIVGLNAASGAMQAAEFGAVSDNKKILSIGMGTISTGATMSTIQITNIGGNDTGGPAALLWVELRNFSLW